MATEVEGEKEARELLLAAIFQATQLTSLLNASLNIHSASSKQSTVGSSAVSLQPEKSEVNYLNINLYGLMNVYSGIDINRHLSRAQYTGIVLVRPWADFRPFFANFGPL